MISVVIPTYKNRGRLQKAVDSALSQTGVTIEVIVVDDNNPNSPERLETEGIMKVYTSDARVRYIRHKENKNGAAARNTGIKESRGDYIAFLDDDDMFLPGKLKEQLSFMECHPEFDAVYNFAGRNGKRIGKTAYEGDVTRELLMLNTFMQTSCLMFRRDTILSIGGFDESFRRHQDYEMLLRFFHEGFKIGCLQQILTEMGANEGENALSGEKLEEVKKHFLGKFRPYIEEINQKEKGFANKVYAKHYAGVFLTHLRTKRFRMAIKTFLSYFFKSPCAFMEVVNNSIKAHI